MYANMSAITVFQSDSIPMNATAYGISCNLSLWGSHASTKHLAV
jgi:hypothetical protein